MKSAVYTARAQKNFKSIGLKLGLSAVMQTQSNEGNFFLAGFDAEKKLPGKGTLQMAWAMSNGEVVGTGNVFNSDESTHNGSAYQIALQQPLPFASAVVRGRFLSASAGFFNPFGGTVTPGSRRGEVNLEMKPLANSLFRLGFTSEDNKTENVDNSRVTFSAAWEQLLHERVRLQFGFDHRAFSDDLNNREVDSNLLTAGAEVKVTDKLQLTVKREQNLGEADPSYPNQTTLGATYQMSALTKLFFTQRLASRNDHADWRLHEHRFRIHVCAPRDGVRRRNAVRQIHFDGRPVSTGEWHQRHRQFRGDRIAESSAAHERVLSSSSVSSAASI